MTPSLVGLIFAGVSLRADPPIVTLGKDATAAVVVTADAPPSLSTTTGEVSAGEPLGGGRFRFRFTPPKERFPTVALLLASVEGPQGNSHAWLALPVRVPADLAIETKPKATVEVTLGDRKYGPLTVDRNGHATLRADVPPGVTSARIRSADRAGNVSVKPLQVPTKPFALLRAFVAPGASASWADAAPLPIEVFVIEPTGAPAERAELRATSSRGGEGEPAIPRGGGIFEVPFRASSNVGSGEEPVEVRLASSPIPSTVRIRLRPGPPGGVSLAADAEPGPLPGARFRVRASVFDGKGNPLSEAAASLSADIGTLVPEGSREATLQLTPAEAARPEVRVQGRVDQVTTELVIRLSTAGGRRHSRILPIGLGLGGLGAGTATVLLAAQVSQFEGVRSGLIQLPAGAAVNLSYTQLRAQQQAAQRDRGASVGLGILGALALGGAVITW